ncbi:adenosylmethionine-8-amino-7-oxononanoate aminotransferase [Clostridium sp. CAG:729]|nr:adenosylmethionine-8-amino-7-oxononanoate aminotransferase [Clostridium sp. CAG:729]
MREPKTNYKQSKYCIAYLDILGGKNLIYKDSENIFLNHLNMFFEDAICEAEMAQIFSKQDVVVKFFSDNILIAIKLNSNDKKRVDKLTKLLNIAGNIQTEILGDGYLMRGAIVEGDFYHDEKFVYGKALVEAVNIEENVAIYPRIIVQKQIQRVIPQYCYQDTDGEYYLNSFLYCSAMSCVGFRNSLLDMLKKYTNNQRIIQKVMWVITYYNKYYSNPYSFNATDVPLITEKEIEDIINNTYANKHNNF